MSKNNKSTVGKKLAELSGGKVSGWSENAKKRRANSSWTIKTADIALKLADLLDDAGLSQKELAEKIGVKPQQISKVFSGKENVTIKTLEEIANKLGMTLCVDFVKNKPGWEYKRTAEKVTVVKQMKVLYVAYEESQVTKPTDNSYGPFGHISNYSLRSTQQIKYLTKGGK